MGNNLRSLTTKIDTPIRETWWVVHEGIKKRTSRFVLAQRPEISADRKDWGVEASVEAPREKSMWAGPTLLKK